MASSTELEVDGREPAVVFLMRHAEPTFPPYDDDPPNPHLNRAGLARSRELTHILRDAGITRILTTGFNRTRETAAPLAKLLGLELELYDRNDLGRLAKELGERRERTLVVGHSSTTHEMVKLLGGDPGPDIETSTEFDRLYVVVVFDAAPTTLLMRFGAEY